MDPRLKKRIMLFYLAGVINALMNYDGCVVKR